MEQTETKVSVPKAKLKLVPEAGALVIALDKGFYAGKRIQEGDKFTLVEGLAFSEKWMKEV